MTSLKTKAWVLGALLVFPACDKGDGQDPSDMPDMGEDATEMEGDNNSPDSKDTGGESQKPKDDKNNKDDKSSEDNSSESTGTEEEKSGDEPIDCKALKVTGTEVGQVPENLTLVDAKGNKVSLHDYCNDVLFVMTGTAD